MINSTSIKHSEAVVQISNSIMIPIKSRSANPKASEVKFILNLMTATLLINLFKSADQIYQIEFKI